MNFAIARPQPRTQSVASAVLSRVKGLISATADRDALAASETRQYSFLSECECPDDCLRDHENE
jgi:hypothetical protein